MARPPSTTPPTSSSPERPSRPRRASLTDRTIKLVALLSGNQCAFPGCLRPLSAPGTVASGAVVLGKIAHIHGERPGAARYLPSLSARARNAPENLVYLCPEHHDLVDAQVADYPAERLRYMKATHEASVARRLAAAVADVGFPELEVVCRRIMTGGVTLDAPSFAVLELRAKMALNQLTDTTARLLSLGLVSAHVVAEYLERMDAVDSGFPERLRAGFVREYRTQVATGLRGDVLFVTMWDFASQGSADFPRRAAGLAVLTHLFEACDIFERRASDAVA